MEADIEFEMFPPRNNQSAASDMVMCVEPIVGAMGSMGTIRRMHVSIELHCHTVNDLGTQQTSSTSERRMVLRVEIQTSM